MQTPLGTSGWFAITTLRNDGTLYLSQGSGTTAMVITDSGGLANSPWPARFRDNKQARNAQDN